MDLSGTVDCGIPSSDVIYTAAPGSVAMKMPTEAVEGLPLALEQIKALKIMVDQLINLYNSHVHYLQDGGGSRTVTPLLPIPPQAGERWPTGMAPGMPGVTIDSVPVEKVEKPKEDFDFIKELKEL